MSQLFNLFPIPVMACERLADEALVAQLLKQLKAEELTANVHSTQLSHTTIVQPDAKPSTQKLAALVTPKLVEMGEHLFGERLNWAIKELWLNVLQAGGRQATHAHANSLLTAVLYLTESDPSANLVFHKPMGGTEFVFSNTNSKSRTTPYNGARWTMPRIGAGDLVIFPSYMLHEVPENRGAPRVSLAMNALPDRLTSHGYTVRFRL